MLRLRVQLVLGGRLLLLPNLRSVSQLHERLLVWRLLIVLASDALAEVRAHDLRFVTLTIVLEASRPLAVATFVVTSLALHRRRVRRRLDVCRTTYNMLRQGRRQNRPAAVIMHINDCKSCAPISHSKILN